MSRRSATHPLWFLRYLEWILLGIVALSEGFGMRPFGLPRSPLINLACVALFALLGLRRSTKHPIKQALFLSLEVGLILFASSVGGIRLFAFLYIAWVTRGCRLLDQKGRLMVTGFAFVLSSLTQAQRLRQLAAIDDRFPDRLGIIWISSAVLTGLVLVFLQLLVNAVMSERRSREQLAAANVQLRQSALRIEALATVQERNRIARDIHDALGHSLTAVNLHLDAALRLLEADPAQAQALLVEAKQLGATALQDVRQSVAALRADLLEGQRLSEAIVSLADDFQRSTGILPICFIDPIESVPPEVKTAVYRIVQEALTNISKYAAATAVEIELRAGAALTLRVQDNGRGFHLSQNTTGFGLQGMRERTLSLGGRFAIDTAPGAGCCVTASFPLPASIAP